MKLTKMQCVGNDYLVADCFDSVINDAERYVLKVCDRHFGIGADGLIALSYSDNADFMIDYYDSDGNLSRVNTNVIRCAAKYVMIFDMTDKVTISFETGTGIKYAVTEGDKITVNAGCPVTTPQLIPLDYTGDEFVDKSLSIGGMEVLLTCVSVNSEPCAVSFVENGDMLNDINFSEIAPKISNHHIFPNGANVMFVNVVNENTLQVRCWKKDIGEVIGCDFGAAASFVASNIKGMINDNANVELLGGDMNINYSSDGFLYITAEAFRVFEIDW